MIYKVEMYDSESPVIDRILELKAEGIVGDDFFVLAQNKEQIAKLVEYRLAHTHTDDENTFWKRIKAFFRGEESMIDKWHRIGLSDEEARRYEEAVANGNILLIMERPEVIIDDEWKEYVPQDDPSWMEKMRDAENYPFLTKSGIEDISDIPSDLISDVIPTEISKNVDTDADNPMNEVPPNKTTL